MSEIDILKKQIEELKELIKLKDQRISELTFNRYPQPPAFILQDYCQHEYPNPWYATVPPNCKKCGKTAHQNVFTWISKSTNE